MTRTEPIYQEIGQRLRDALAAARLNQEELADRLDVSGSLVNQWVMGARRIQVEDLRRVAVELDKPMAWFLGQDAPTETPPEALPAGVVAQLSDHLARVVRAVLAEERAQADTPATSREAGKLLGSTDYRKLKGLPRPITALAPAALMVG